MGKMPPADDETQAPGTVWLRGLALARRYSFFAAGQIST